MRDPVTRIEIGSLPLLSRGKVRDIYDLGDELLIVSSDRISAFDSILPNGIPDKGRVLNLLSAFWFEKTSHLVKNHLISVRTADLPQSVNAHKDELDGRFAIAKKAEMLPLECIVRGYLSGSGWKDYRETGSVCGIRLPSGLKESDKLPEPIFTPSTKAVSGHDENTTYEHVVGLIGEETAVKVRETALALYSFAGDYAAKKGIIIADTKFEFGLIKGDLVLCDEVLTPDSSRFWPADSYEPGRSQPSFDKQYVRDYLLSINWDKNPPAPELPPEVVAETSRKYREAYEKLVGATLPSKS